MLRKRDGGRAARGCSSLDANTGQNAIRQAQEFKKAVAVTGIALTKLDGSARGGVVLGVAQETGLALRGARDADDLADFDAREFAADLAASLAGRAKPATRSTLACPLLRFSLRL